MTGRDPVKWPPVRGWRGSRGVRAGAVRGATVLRVVADDEVVATEIVVAGVGG